MFDIFSRLKLPVKIALAAFVATVDQTVLEKLNSKAAQSASPEFQNFQKVLDKMRTIPAMTIAAQYQAAVAATGITLDKINAGIASMHQRLDQEEATYAQVLEAATRTEVTARQERLEANKRKIQESEDQITKLRAEIANLENQGLDLEREIRDANYKIQTGAETFKSTVAYAKQQLTRLNQEAAQNISQGASQ